MICAWPPCGREFTPDPRAAHKAKFCGVNCRTAEYRQRRYETDPEFREWEKTRQRDDYWTMSPERRAIRAMGKRRRKALHRRSVRAARS